MNSLAAPAGECVWPEEPPRTKKKRLARPQGTRKPPGSDSPGFYRDILRIAASPSTHRSAAPGAGITTLGVR